MRPVERGAGVRRGPGGLYRVGIVGGGGGALEGCAEGTAASGDGCGGGAGCAGAMPGIGGCRRRGGV